MNFKRLPHLKIFKQNVRRKIFIYFQVNREGLCYGSPRFVNGGGSKPWRGTAQFVVRFAKKPNCAVAGRFAVCQGTNRTVAVRCGPCALLRILEPWSILVKYRRLSGYLL